jgi:F-type H+-transporting ATPase subunit b
MARVKQGAMADLNAEASRVMDGLRREAATRAIARALAVLPEKLDQAAQDNVVNQSISTLGKA